jgi:3-hydroxy-9,10-secoandrosta-1,3,5(10)-triene-9,17-dione monooxygenase reductase component
VSWTPSEQTGSPILEGTLGYVDCQIQSAHEAGDHYVVIGRVLDLGIPDGETDAGKPLLFFEGKYATTDS